MTYHIEYSDEFADAVICGYLENKIANGIIPVMTEQTREEFRDRVFDWCESYSVEL